MAKPSGSPASFIERDLLSGSHTGSAPTHETSRPSAKIPVRNTHNTESTRKVVSAVPQKLAARRTWVPALLIWVFSCAVHFGIFALALTRDLHQPMSKINRNLDYLSYLNIWYAHFY